MAKSDSRSILDGIQRRLYVVKSAGSTLKFRKEV